MYVIRNSLLPKAELPGIEHTTLAGSANGLRHLSIWRQSLAPGGATPPHRHDCEEVVVVLAGRGRLQLPEGPQEFGADTTLIIPAGVDHQIESIGDEALVTIAAFAATPVGVSLPDGSEFELPWAS